MVVEDDHRHCKVCGKVVAPGKDVCGPACRDRREAMARTRRAYVYVIYATIGFIIVLFALGFIHV